MVVCGNTVIGDTYVQIIRVVVIIAKIIVPVILVVMGMLDFAKVLVSKEAKLGETFFLRLVSAALLYFIVPIVELLMNIIISTGVIDESYNCVRCLAENKCD